jgi:hypothetical protein
MEEKQNVLVGKVITAIHLADDKKALKFDIEGGEPIIADCQGDCCSETWVENIENPWAILGSPVLKAENIDMPDLGTMEGRDVVAYYGFKIETVKGTCTIDYRNDSNGYYSGDLAWPGDYYYPGVFDQNLSKQDWKQVT